MSGKIEGGAAPALAAHSKDASAPSPNPAASATGKDGSTTSGAAADGPDNVSRLSSQARDGANRFASSASDAASEVMREQPVTMLLTAAGLGMILGLLLARR